MADITELRKDKLVVTADIEGKKVIDSRGKEIGTVKSLHMNPTTFNIEA
ncbi:PRC-barrel domain-containing protein [Candidatus Woesearchaeota archaeon]|nr:PRC-barrel domain-containing protein [Candidatus Woesearchaeota archaeon]